MDQSGIRTGKPTGTSSNASIYGLTKSTADMNLSPPALLPQAKLLCPTSLLVSVFTMCLHQDRGEFGTQGHQNTAPLYLPVLTDCLHDYIVHLIAWSPSFHLCFLH